MSNLPETQWAVQLVGPGELRLNTAKEVCKPGPRQLLVKVEAVGLCFSDLKVLKQFHEHPRKGTVISGLDASVLQEIPSYAPDGAPTVPGHEIVCRVVEVGDAVDRFRVGERYLLQPDIRFLQTAGSNAAIGYNFEGALQEYLLLDERIMKDPQENEYLLPVEERLGASEVALVEPWACVEDSYVTRERNRILEGGRLLILADAGRAIAGLEESLSPKGKPVSTTVLCAESDQLKNAQGVFPGAKVVDDLDSLEKEGFDDVVYFGRNAETIERLSPLLGRGAILNIVRGAEPIGRDVMAGVGRIHYGPTRWVGTVTNDASDGYALIPRDGEVRDNDSILIIGAGGPMGQMHVLRDLCSGRKGLSVVASDFDDARLAMLARKALPSATASGARFQTLNPKNDASPAEGRFSYIVVMAPVAPLVAQAIKDVQPGGIINIFAGVPAPVSHPLDLDAMIEKRVFVFGTSGSTMEDMTIVLNKLTGGMLDTDASVDAISGMAGAIDGIAAVENRTMAGKIIVYPQLTSMPLIALEKIGETYPTVAGKLRDGRWCKEAEQELLRIAST